MIGGGRVQFDLGGGVGRLPDEATRKRMAALVDALPELPPLPQNPAAAPGIALQPTEKFVCHHRFPVWHRGKGRGNAPAP